MTIHPIVKRSIETNPLTWERMIMIALIQSRRFYLEHRDFICPYQVATQNWRRDFATSQYNLLYSAIDRYWRLFDHLDGTQDYSIEQNALKDMLIDQANAGGADPTVVQGLLTEIQDDFYRNPLAPEQFTMLRGEALGHWLQIRVTRQLTNKLHAESQVGFLTLENVEKVVAETKRYMKNVGANNAVNMGNLMLGKMQFVARVPCSLVGLNRALGGGFGRGQGTMIAGVNSGGKTVLATQLAYDLARYNQNVVLITTEQRPEELMHRIVCNATNTPFEEFVQRRHVTSMEACEVLNIPEFLWHDPSTNQKVQETLYLLGHRVYCLDWSKGEGQTVTANLDAEIDQLVNLGWDPDFLIFDWIGGGLRAAEKPEHLRHIYQESADHLINHCKKTGRSAIVLAQLDKAKATNRSRTTMAMLSECKTMSNNYTNFVGISALVEEVDNSIGGTDRNLSMHQYLNVEKSRQGPGGLVPVETYFRFQRFRDRQKTLQGGS